MALPSWSLTLPERVNCCALMPIVISRNIVIRCSFFAFIPINNAKIWSLLYYSRHSHDASLFSQRKLMRNQRRVLTSLPPKLRMKSR